MKKPTLKSMLCALILTTLLLSLGCITASAAYVDPETAGEEWHKIIVNPWNKKPSDYSIDLVTVQGYEVDYRCASRLRAMLRDCEAAGHDPLVISGYRSNATQSFIYNRNVQQYVDWGYSYSEAKVKAAKSTAVPGTSEHQIGLAVDIVDRDYQALVNSQANTDTQQWLMKNCWKYGFILRYPKDTTDVTGIVYEPWHYRYVGETLAKEIYDAGVTLEEYLGAAQPGNVRISGDADSGKNVIKWDKVEKAEKYRIYRSESKNGSYKRIYTTKYCKYTDKKAEAGTKYYYYVQAVTAYGDVSKPSSKVVRTCDLPRPVISLSNAESTGKIRITWDAVPGAVKYEVYRADGKDAEFKKVYTTKNTTLVNGSIVPGNPYYYKVRAVSDNNYANSALSKSKWRTCDLPRPVISLKNDPENGKIVISWPAVDGAVGYRVYRAGSAEGEYSLIAETEGSSFMDISAVAGEACYYKVRAVAEKSAANSALSKRKWRTCDLPAVKAEVLLPVGNTPTLTWEAVEGAVKYNVYRADGVGSEYNLVWTGTDLLFTDEVPAGGSVSYKVRALASNTAANGAFSDPIFLALPEV